MSSGKIKLLFIFSSILCWTSCQKETNLNEKIFRLAYVMSSRGVVHSGAKKFAEIVKKNTDGRIKVKLYPSGQLGNGRVEVEGLRLGSVDGVITGPAIIGWYAPQYGAIEAPFVFRNYQHLDKVMYGKIGNDIKNDLWKKHHILMLSYWYRGPRYLTTSNKIVKEPKDLIGLKLRVPELPTYIKSWKIFGANPTPIPYSDMFMALKLGVVEGQENPLEVIYSENLYEVQKYITETKHLISFYIFSVGEKFESKFSKSTQKIIINAVKQARKYQNNLVLNNENKYKNKLKNLGMKFIKPDRKAFKDSALKRIPTAFRGNWVDSLYVKIRNVE